MKKAVLTLMLFLFVFSVAAQVNYQIETGEEETAINASIILSCTEEEDQSCPVNSWQLSWKVPENAEITSVNDSQGEVEDYTRDRNRVQIQTNTGPARKSEKIQIQMAVEESADRVVDDLYTREISLAGMPDKATAGSVESQDLLSATITEGFEKSFQEDSMNFRGEGGVSIRLNFGEGREEGEYMFFGGDAENSSLAYRVAVGTTGLRQSYPFIPVAILSGDDYDSQSFDWSEGEYSAGVIRVRESEESTAPVLTEETVHAFNAEALSFDTTSSSYLDEGIAGHVQSLVRKKMIGESKMRTLFGEKVSYTERANGSLYEYTKPSKGDREQLWEYYQENMSFMKSWRPQGSQNRDFGYAYSELIVKNYVSNNNTLKDFYSSLEKEKLETNQEKWDYYSQYLDLTPCRYESRERFENCLEKVNSYDYPVYYVEELPERESRDIQVQELEVPNYTSQGRFRNAQLFEKGFVSSLIEFLKGLWAGL